MKLLRQKTVSVGNQSQTVVLRRRSAPDGVNAQYLYTVEDKDTGDRFGDPFTRKDLAMDEFERTVEYIRRGMRSARNDRRRDFPFFYL